MISIPATASSYYDTMPPHQLRTGDLWKDIPCGGLFMNASIDALLITPACDLANMKTDGLTFLPILPARRVISGPPLHKKHLDKFYAAIELISSHLDKTIPEREAPTFDLLSTSHNFVHLSESLPHKSKQKLANHIQKLTIGNKLIQTSSTWSNHVECSEIHSDAYHTVHGNDWNRIASSLITNSHQNDLHFLPSDQQDPSISAVHCHSFVMLRYPFTVHTALLSQDSTQNTEYWGRSIHRFEGAISEKCATRVPLKTGTLNRKFLIDILSRYQSLFGRAGSPDFSRQSIEIFSKELSA